MAGKPYKLWSADRRTRKSVVASSLADLLSKGNYTCIEVLPIAVTWYLHQKQFFTLSDMYISFFKQICLVKEQEKILSLCCIIARQVVIYDTHIYVLGCKKFGYDSDVCLVLEEDGTEVDEEEYFQFIEENTVFLLLREREKWAKGEIF